MKEQEFRLLEAISANESVTQAGLAAHLGMAVGSVNWYIKRLTSRGYLKATRMNRTRLRYNLTPDGVAAFTRNAVQYMKDSLLVYKDLRERARETVAELQRRNVRSIHLDGDDEVMDILRLTCIEAGIALEPEPIEWMAWHQGRGYQLKEMK